MVANKILTLVLIRDHARVLLGLKKRGFGHGRWNGFGGKVEQGETILEGAMRELKEECGISARKLDEVGRLEFEFVGEPQKLEVHVFTGSTFTGTPVETEEMKPQWFPIHSVPYTDMWPDDQYWFPLFLKGSKFNGVYVFEGHDKIIRQTLEEVDNLPD